MSKISDNQIDKADKIEVIIDRYFSNLPVIICDLALKKIRNQIDSITNVKDTKNKILSILDNMQNGYS